MTCESCSAKLNSNCILSVMTTKRKEQHECPCSQCLIKVTCNNWCTNRIDYSHYLIVGIRIQTE